MNTQPSLRRWKNLAQEALGMSGSSSRAQWEGRPKTTLKCTHDSTSLSWRGKDKYLPRTWFKTATELLESKSLFLTTLTILAGVGTCGQQRRQGRSKRSWRWWTRTQKTGGGRLLPRFRPRLRQRSRRITDGCSICCDRAGLGRWVWPDLTVGLFPQCLCFTTSTVMHDSLALSLGLLCLLLISSIRVLSFIDFRPLFSVPSCLSYVLVFFAPCLCSLSLPALTLPA
mmetsp:Transcript_47463/g.96992  ORF Transcript_47463/g.96992 Transcript_47463/m.96992 type:complete len:227 (+) Transcript_47463:296-976(+)